MTTFLEEVYPTGLLGRCLDSISNPRRHRWKAYLRACKRIPAGSPCFGSTSFVRINERRIGLINAAHGSEDEQKWEELDADPEYRALQQAVSKWTCGQLIVVPAASATATAPKTAP